MPGGSFVELQAVFSEVSDMFQYKSAPGDRVVKLQNGLMELPQALNQAA